MLLGGVKGDPALSRVILNIFLTMKADESANSAVLCLAQSGAFKGRHMAAQSALSSALVVQNAFK